MQRYAPALILAVVCAAAAVAAEPPAAPKGGRSEPAVAPPPPGMDEPGVAPAPPPAESSVPTAPKNDLATAAPRDAKGEPAPDVAVKQQGDDTVEEYRRSGKLYMIRIVPKSGVAQTYMADGEGRLVRDPKNGPASPVYYTLYQWK